MRGFKKNINDELDQIQSKRTEIKRKIKETEKTIYTLREESYLLDDLDYIDSHIERFKKYKSIKSKLEETQKEIHNYITQLSDDKFKFDMAHLERKYKDLINLNPPEGLSAYLEEFESTQKATEIVVTGENNDERIKPIIDIIDNYQKLDAELTKTFTYIEDFLGIEILERNLDHIIVELERRITHLKQQIQLENA